MKKTFTLVIQYQGALITRIEDAETAKEALATHHEGSEGEVLAVIPEAVFDRVLPEMWPLLHATAQTPHYKKEQWP